MRRFKKKFKRPKVPWDSTRITEELAVEKEYGLRRKREIWKSEAILRNFRARARELIASKDKEKESILINKLTSLGLLEAAASLDDVLALTKKDLLNRRLQTIVLKKGLAATPLQARQLVAHGHVLIKGRKMPFPSYIVNRDEESAIESDLKFKDTHAKEKEGRSGSAGEDRGSEEGAGSGAGTAAGTEAGSGSPEGAA
ncbi:MAG: 30S ribosomal protein S4 [Candidatus Aenigmarchaeota archaeon]|nr:30S ribosomal protein S4 [Candidatus Aenigmarchaeota archaeon]